MNITVSSRHTRLSPALEAAARERIGRLERFDQRLDRAEVHFSAHHNPRISESEVCEVVMAGPGSPLQCKVQAADPFAAVEMAASKLERQLAKRKTQRMVRLRGS
ncbi:MAG: ribosome-associated translation inhibitor RaiA [Acidimicrobiia bacterium]|nr:ribosome-associated translation inhibitor RaiA [Acidimicrobiia bacterium]